MGVKSVLSRLESSDEYIRSHYTTLIYHIPPHLSGAQCIPVTRRNLIGNGAFPTHHPPSIQSAPHQWLDLTRARNVRGHRETMQGLWLPRPEEQLLHALPDARRRR